MFVSKQLTSITMVTFLLALAFGRARAEEKVINIKQVGAGAANAQYIEDGKEVQFNVVVVVNDTVKWTNKTQNTHTATSDISVAGKRLFDTQNIDPGTSKSYTFRQADYDAAVQATGAKVGNQVHLGYFCGAHPGNMGGKLVLRPLNFRDAKNAEGH
jgi:plastocyanin